MTNPVPGLEAHRRKADRIFTQMALALAPVCIGISIWSGRWLVGTLVTLLATAGVVAAARSHSRIGRHLAATCFLLFPAAVTEVTGGLIESHFGFFVVIGFLIWFRDWQVYATATVVAALHHALLAWAQSAGLPVHLMNHDAGHGTYPFGMVLLHATYVLLESVVLGWLAFIAARDTDALDHTAAEQLEARRDTQVVNELLERLGRAADEADAVRQTLQAMRSSFGWSYAGWWVATREGGQKVLTLAFDDGELNPAFTTESRGTRFTPGQGIVGRAFASGEVQAVDSLAALADCPRRSAAAVAGVSSATAIPVFASGKIIGVVDFLATQVVHVGPERRKVLNSVSQVLSDTLERLRTADKERREHEELQRKVDQILAVVAAAQEGDLTREVGVVGNDAVGRLGTGLAGFLGDLRGRIAQIARGADDLSAATGDLAGTSQGMCQVIERTARDASAASAAAEQVSASVQSVAVGADEMGASIREIARNATEASSVAAQAVKAAEETSQTIAKLGESSNAIGTVVRVITSIAEQTNLLALNATIEAARAGEMGKGFAVVANEVKELAKQTARATEDIGKRIGGIQADTEFAIAAIGRINEIIARINDLQVSIAGAVEEQSATTSEIGRNIAEAAAGSRHIAERVTTVARAMEEVNHGAEGSRTAATALAGVAEELKGLVDRFSHSEEHAGAGR